MASATPANPKRRSSPKVALREDRAAARAARATAALPALVGALLAAACAPAEGPAVASIEPGTGSARGGETIVVEGSGFSEGAEVLFGDAPAESIARRSEGRLEVVTPRHLAGAVDLRIRNADGDEATVPRGFAFEPLELRFLEAAEHYVPDLSEAAPSDGAAADFDGDGDPDVLITARGEPARLLRNTGAGSFVEGETLWVHDTRALWVEDLDLDGDADVLLCNGGGQASRIYLNDGTAGFGAASGAAVDDGATECRAAAMADLDGDGVRDLVLAGGGPVGAGKGYLRILRGTDSAGGLSFEPMPDTEPPADVEGAALGKVETSSEAVTGTLTLTQEEAAQGSTAAVATFDMSAAAGTVAFVLPVPELHAVPEALELEVAGDSGADGAMLFLRVVDAEGEQYVAEAGTAAFGGFEHIAIDDLASWTASGGDADGEIDLPIQSVALLVEAAAAGPKGEIVIDDVRLEAADIGSVLVDDFERVDFAYAWPGSISSVAAGDLDADGDADVVVSSAEPGGAPSLRLLLGGAAASAAETGAGAGGAGAASGSAGSAALFGEAAAGVVPAPPERVAFVLLLDFDGDEDLDVLAVGADGQDRLLVNDGHAHFFDDTVAALPVDHSSGRTAGLRDLDMDGIGDLVIANHEAVSRLYLGRGARGFVDATPALPLVESRTLRLLPLDVDGDGDEDVFALNAPGERSRLFVSVEPTLGP